MPALERSSIFRTMQRASVLLTVLGLVATIVMPSSVPSARAAEPRDPRDPDARLQVLLRSVKVLDDHDWGEGEIELFLRFWETGPDCSHLNGYKCPVTLAEMEWISITANNGDLIQLDRILPDPTRGAVVFNDGIGPDIGIPVWRDRTYRMELKGRESDVLYEDDLGSLVWEFPFAGGWDLGRRTEQTSIQGIYSAGHGAGGLEVDYEIRNMPLPDLRPGEPFVASPPPGSDSDRLCVPVVNAGTMPMRKSFQVAFRIDGEMLPGSPTLFSDGIASGEFGTFCTDTSLPSLGQHVLSATVDEPRLVAEENELNNRAEVAYVGASANRSDLAFNALKVNGKAPSVPNVCKAGKNTVGVTVENVGGVAAGAFTVRLAVDAADSNVKEKAVVSLAAGKTGEVVFDDVSFDAGGHTLYFTLDSRNALSEADEENNIERAVARCSQ